MLAHRKTFPPRRAFQTTCRSSAVWFFLGTDRVHSRIPEDLGRAVPWRGQNLWCLPCADRYSGCLTGSTVTRRARFDKGTLSRGRPFHEPRYMKAPRRASVRPFLTFSGPEGSCVWWTAYGTEESSILQPLCRLYQLILAGEFPEGGPCLRGLDIYRDLRRKWIKQLGRLPTASFNIPRRCLQRAKPLVVEVPAWDRICLPPRSMC